MFDLTGKVALVTGAGQSIGAGIATTLADAGAAVAVNDLVADRAEATAALIRDAGGTAFVAPFDVTDYDAVFAGVAAIERDLGPVDVLVNNAGIAEGSGAKFFLDDDATPEYWARWVDLNLYGVMYTCKAVVPGMVARGFGRVVTISSGAGTQGLAIGMSAYAAGKGGAIGFMRHLAMETAKAGVTANTLALGMMASPGNVARFTEQQIPKLNPVGRLGTGHDVGTTVVWLAAEGSWITGQTIQVNGGAWTT
jgi:NAD(P)-dependent dehydrogenase (short-subunit alcohol dehydrogenase family)